MLPKTIKYILLIIIVFTGVATDQASKQWAEKNLKNQPVRSFITNIINFGYTENHGMVFGINNRKSNTVSKNILLMVRIILSVGLIGYQIIHRDRSFLFHLPFLLILAGAIGNVIDSLLFGHVIDFIHMHLGTILDWPFLFNLADAYVCIGMGILVLQNFLSGEKRGQGTSHQMEGQIPSNGK